MKTEVEMLPPLMPNFLPYKIGSNKNINNRIPVGDLTEKEAIEYGELMKQAFVDHWRKKSKQLNKTTLKP